MTTTLRQIKSRAFGTDITNQLQNFQPKTKGKHAVASGHGTSTKPTFKRLKIALSDGDDVFSPQKQVSKPIFNRQEGIECLRVNCNAPSAHQPLTTLHQPLTTRHLSISGGAKAIHSSPRPSPKSPFDGVLGPRAYPETPYLNHSMSLSFLNEIDGSHYIRNRAACTPLVEGEYHVSKKDREILIDWIIRICNKFELSEYTVYLSINIFDRYLASSHGKIQGDRQHKFQLIACATMWMASKYHEVYAPEPDDFSVLTAGTITKDELIAMELTVWIAINFELTIETPLSFIPRFIDIGSAYIDMKKTKDTETQKKVLHSMMMFCLEISSLDYKLSLEKPSKLAAAIMYYCCIGTNVFSWNQFKDDNVLKFVNDVRVNDVLSIMQKIHRISIKVEKEKKSRLYEKYSSKEQYRVTSIAKKMHIIKS